MACRISLPRPGIEPQPMAVQVQNPNHWTTRKFLCCGFFCFCFNFFNLSLAGNFAAALGLSLVVASRGYCLVAGHGLCIVVASL